MLRVGDARGAERAGSGEPDRNGGAARVHARVLHGQQAVPAREDGGEAEHVRGVPEGEEPAEGEGAQGAAHHAEPQEAGGERGAGGEAGGERRAGGRAVQRAVPESGLRDRQEQRGVQAHARVGVGQARGERGGGRQRCRWKRWKRRQRRRCGVWRGLRAAEHARRREPRQKRRSGE